MSEQELASIKKPGESEVISNAEFEHRIREIAKCKRDIVYFAEKYFKIINLDAGLTTIKLYPKQKELLKYFTGEKRCIVLASRQSSKCVSFWTLISIKHKKIKWLKLKIPIGLFYILSKITINNKNESATDKFIDIINIYSWQVESDEGYVDIKTINKTIKFQEYVLTFKSGIVLRCADNHILITQDNDEVYAKDANNLFIKSKYGIDQVISVEKTNNIKHMYDLSLSNDSNHLYYTNGILSHNTTTYTIYALWLLMFHAEKKIMLLANKADTALEILGRIRMAYEYCPSFLKPAVAVWNKGEIVFANMSAIKSFATSSDAARGYSCNCVSKDSIIRIRLFKLNWLSFNIKIKYLKYFKYLNIFKSKLIHYNQFV